MKKLKQSVAEAIAKVAVYVAKVAYNEPSKYGTYEPVEPENLGEKLKQL